jgi:large subunit ribosomal protein L30
VADKTLKTIRIKWVRSGIGFTHHQKTIVRSLGLNKLNHTVVRPDTPQIRGIVAAVPHLLEIVPEPVAPAWASLPEYTVHAPAAAPSDTPVATTSAVAVETLAASKASEKEEVTSPAGTPETNSATQEQPKEATPEGAESA